MKNLEPSGHNNIDVIINYVLFAENLAYTHHHAEKQRVLKVCLASKRRFLKILDFFGNLLLSLINLFKFKSFIIAF